MKEIIKTTYDRYWACAKHGQRLIGARKAWIHIKWLHMWAVGKNQPHEGPERSDHWAHLALMETRSLYQKLRVID